MDTKPCETAKLSALCVYITFVDRTLAYLRLLNTNLLAGVYLPATDRETAVMSAKTKSLAKLHIKVQIGVIVLINRLFEPFIRIFSNTAPQNMALLER